MKGRGSGEGERVRVREKESGVGVCVWGEGGVMSGLVSWGVSSVGVLCCFSWSLAGLCVRARSWEEGEVVWAMPLEFIRFCRR